MIDSELMDSINEEISLAGVNSQGVAVVKNLQGELDLTQIGDAFLAFLWAFGFDYIESVDFNCTGDIKHGSVL